MITSRPPALRSDLSDFNPKVDVVLESLEKKQFAVKKYFLQAAR